MYCLFLLIYLRNFGCWRYGRFYLYVLCMFSLTEIIPATQRKGKVYVCDVCMYRGAPAVNM